MKYNTTHNNSNFISQNFSKGNKQSVTLIFFLLFCAISFAQTTWNGTINNDWFDPGNWSDGVPDANDDVTIDPSSNDPSISLTTALANSILVNESATLTIAASGTLDVQLTNSSLTTNAITILGSVDNSGTIIIVATASGFTNGIELGDNIPEIPGTFNNLNGALIQISNYSNNGIFIPDADGNTFTNDGAIDIDGLGGGIHGIQATTGSFTNSANGAITVDNVSNNSMWLFNEFVFNNSGTINIGLDSSAAGSSGIENRGTFSNLTGGIIDIFGFSNRGIDNFSSGTMEFPAEFNNSGSISLDGNMGSGNYGIVVRGEFSTFNNQTGGSIEVTDVTTNGIAAGFLGANDFGSVFNNSGNITLQGINNTLNQGVSNAKGTFNHNAGTIIIDNATTSISFSDPGMFNNSASIITQNLPFATSNIINGPDDSFTNNVGGSINGFGQIQSNSFVDNGGTIIPGEPYGIIRFNGDVDLSSAVIDLDINGSGTAGTDYDKIENNTFSDHTITLGGTLNLNITYTPSVDLEYIKIIEAGSEVIGEFTTVNGLPATEWELLYNYPTEGDVSLEYGAINSVQSGAFSDPNTWADGIVPNMNNPAIIEDGHTVTLDASQTFEIARLQLDATATIVIPQTSAIVINDSFGTAVINDGTMDIDGMLDIDGSQSIAIDNDGTISLDGTTGTNGVIDITDTATTAINNKGSFIIGDNSSVNIDDANIGIENTNDIVVNEDGLLEIDFTLETAIITKEGSTMTNNGQTFIGMDVTATNSIGLYGIDHSGYLLNEVTGLIEISGATDSQILLPFIDTTLLRLDISDGSVDNFGQMNLNGSQTNAVEQGDNPSAVQGKYKHKLKKRPTPNPGRDLARNNGVSSYINQEFSLLRGNGIIESDIAFLDGGIVSPGLLAGDEGIIVFDGDEDFQNVTLEIDINGKTLKGTDYDLIALVGTTNLDGTLDIAINYMPEIGDIITFIESDNVTGSFVNPILPPDWSIKYNYPNQGDVSVEYGELLSVDENGLDNVIIFSEFQTDNVFISGVLTSETIFQLFDITGRLILSKNLDTTSTLNNIDVSSLASGNYIANLRSKSEFSRSQKIVIR